MHRGFVPVLHNPLHLTSGMGPPLVWKRPDNAECKIDQPKLQEIPSIQPTSAKRAADASARQRIAPGGNNCGNNPAKKQRIDPQGNAASGSRQVPATSSRPPRGNPTKGAQQPAPAPSSAHTAVTKSSPAPPATAQTDLAVKLRQQQEEMEQLKQQLLEKAALVAKQKEAQLAKEAAKLQKQQQQAEATRKREQLAKGFKSLAAGAVSEDHAEEPVHPSVTAGQGAGQRVAVADEFDIARVLDSKSDLECLKLAPGATLAAIRRSYKQLAVALHPDKCSLEHAAEAFQRLHKAYTNLTKSGPCS